MQHKLASPKIKNEKTVVACQSSKSGDGLHRSHFFLPPLSFLKVYMLFLKAQEEEKKNKKIASLYIIPPGGS